MLNLSKKTTLKEVLDARADYRDAILAHYAKGHGTMADGDRLRRLQARAIMLAEALACGQ